MKNPRTNTSFKKKTLFLIDWLSTSIVPVGEIETEDWPAVAEMIIHQVNKNNNLEKIFGHLRPSVYCLPAYDITYRFGNSEVYLAYAKSLPQSGVCLQFRGSALQKYRRKTGKEILSLYRNLPHKEYKINIARIDLAFDRINCGDAVLPIYEKLLNDEIRVYYTVTRKDGSSHLYRWKNKRYDMPQHQYDTKLPEYTGLAIYIGSLTSDSRLVIYDKLLDLIAKAKKNHRRKPDEYADYIRYEARLSGKWGNAAAKIILDNRDDDSCMANLAKLFISRFQMKAVETEKPEPWSSELLRRAESAKKPTSAADESEAMEPCTVKLNYMYYLTGDLATTQRLLYMYGEAAVKRAFAIKMELAKTLPMSAGTKRWISKNAEDLKEAYETIAALEQGSLDDQALSVIKRLDEFGLLPDCEEEDFDA